MEHFGLFKTIGEFDPEFKLSELVLDEEKARWLNTILTKDYENITREMADYFGNDEIIKEVEAYRRQKCIKHIEDFFDKFINSCTDSKVKRRCMIKLCCTTLSEGFIEKYINILRKDKPIPKHFRAKLFCNPNISEAFVERYLKGEFGKVCNNKQVWNVICEKTNISEAFVEKYIRRILWNVIASNPSISEAFFERHMEDIRKMSPKMFKDICTNFCINENLSEAFFEKYMDPTCKNGYLDWFWLCYNRGISEAFFEKYWYGGTAGGNTGGITNETDYGFRGMLKEGDEKVDFSELFEDDDKVLNVYIGNLAENTDLSEEFFKRHQIRRIELFKNTNLSESFLESILKSIEERFETSDFFANPRVSEACIERYINNIKNIETEYTFWDIVCKNTGLSEAFFDKYISKGCYVNWFALTQNTSMSEAFFERHLADVDNVDLLECWYNLLGNSNMSPEFFERHIFVENEDDKTDESGYFDMQDCYGEFQGIFENTFEKYIERQSKLN